MTNYGEISNTELRYVCPPDRKNKYVSSKSSIFTFHVFKTLTNEEFNALPDNS